MDDWEEDSFVPAPPGVKVEQVKSLWADEDADEDDVKESWEDEEEPVKESIPEPPAAKPASKPASKTASKKGKEPAEEIAESSNEEVLADPLAEKLRQQRLVEEADFKTTVSLFGKKNDEKSLDSFIPKSESDFIEYAELLSHKIRPYEKSYHYIGLLKAVMRLSMTSLKAADAKEIASSVSAIANEKLKAEKEANAGKKKAGAKKKQLHVDKVEDDMASGGNYNDMDDYDFM